MSVYASVSPTCQSHFAKKEAGNIASLHFILVIANRSIDHCKPVNVVQSKPIEN